MTEPIHVKFVGDCWNDPAQFQQQLNQHPLGEPLILDFRHEGPSLQASGVTDMINTWLKDRQLLPTMVHLNYWSNPVEFVPYLRLSNCRKISHCFTMAKDYWQHTEPTLEQQLQYKRLFGLFVGRMNPGRAVVLYQAMKYPENIFASRMKSVMPMPWCMPNDNKRELDNISHWLSLQEQRQMFDWYDHNHVSSVDDTSYGDHYLTPTSWIDTNTSLLQHYHNFAVEIVCETYVFGDTFLPSEKTIRPIMAAKPVMVYGPKYFLARLRGLGFQTYHSIWDESYDLFQGPERWSLMQSTMDRLLKCNRDEQQQILTRAHEIAMFNRQRLSDICHGRVSAGSLAAHDYLTI
jgi:hypothetical protein